VSSVVAVVAVVVADDVPDVPPSHPLEEDTPLFKQRSINKTAVATRQHRDKCVADHSLLAKKQAFLKLRLNSTRRVAEPLARLDVDPLNSDQVRIAFNFLSKEECPCPEQSIFDLLIMSLATKRSPKGKLVSAADASTDAPTDASTVAPTVSTAVDKRRRAKERKKTNSNR